MRYGVLADVHANLHALETVLAFLSTQDVDGYLCAGDLVGYGPLPNECVRRVLDLPGRCVAGNHDLIVLDRLTDERCVPSARASLRWTRGVLEDDARALLSRLPLGTRVRNVAVYHGSVLDPQEYVLTETRALDCLRDLERAVPGADILILGHTHHPMAVSKRRGSLLHGSTGEVSLRPDESIVLNPGSVGQSRSRDVRARVMVLDLAARVATFHAVPYDAAGCREALRKRGLPPGSCGVQPPRWRAVAGMVKDRLPRLRAAPADTRPGPVGDDPSADGPYEQRRGGSSR